MINLDIRWQFCRFENLTLEELYQLISAREEVFVVEQECAYLDCDGYDLVSWHLIGWSHDNAGKRFIATYVRIIDPACKFEEPSIGRVFTHIDVRGKGLGKELMRRALSEVKTLFAGFNVRISAQHRLEKFYSELGFHTVSNIYDEDGIPHVQMLWRFKNTSETLGSHKEISL